jgi:hypothetical protein
MSAPIPPNVAEDLRRVARYKRIVLDQMRRAAEMGLACRPNWRVAEDLREAWREALPDVAPPALTETGDYEQAQQAVDLFLHTVEDREAPPPGPPALRLEVRDGAAYLDGRRIDAEMTPEARQKALVYLGALIAAAGAYVSGGDLERQMGRRGERGHWYRVRQSLPADVQALILTDRRKGNCLSAAAWCK